MSDKEATVTEEAVEFAASDGYVIQGTYFAASAAQERGYAVVMNSGVGIGSRSYRHFANFLAKSGIPVLTYDYRGIGKSKPRSLRRFLATIEDWAELDCAAAIDWASSRCGGMHLVGIGHSVGSLLFGGAPNCCKLTKLVMIGAHTGFSGDYRRAYRLPMAIVWHGVMPVVTRLFGFFPGRLLRLGDDIPKGVALQWAARRTGMFRRSPGPSNANRMQRLVERFAAIDTNALILTFTDDGFATEAGATRVRAYFPKLLVEHWLISPPQVGVTKIGHFGFFREEASRTMWPLILDHIVNFRGAPLVAGQVRTPPNLS